jgi:hypothetical protein
MVHLVNICQIFEKIVTALMEKSVGAGKDYFMKKPEVKNPVTWSL